MASSFLMQTVRYGIVLGALAAPLFAPHPTFAQG
jgi:hypothetical protein